MGSSEELIQRVRACKSAEELVALAKEYNIETTEEEASAFLRDFNEAENQEGEIADEELENVSGGSSCSGNFYDMVYYKRSEDVEFVFNVGDTAECKALLCNTHTAKVTIRNREVYRDSDGDYYDRYYVEKVPGGRSLLINGWFSRENFEK